MDNKPYVISIVSTKSGMGKTTLIEALVKIFKDKNYKVGVLKHDAHRFEIDKEGKDSWRFTKAGADNVIISSSEKLAMIRKLEKQIEVKDMLYLFDDVDLVLIEGFKDNPYDKIEVHRKEVDDVLLCKNNNYDSKTFIAIATNEKVDGILNLDLNDVNAIADFIENWIHQIKKTEEIEYQYKPI